MGRSNEEFEIGGVSHVALVCRDMARTVDFYQGVLGMPLVKTIELPVDMAFFWFPNAPEPAPGVAAAPALPTEGEIVSAIGSMNHLAFNVPADKFDDYVERLRAKGVAVSDVLNHDDSEWGVAPEVTPDVFVRSVYFFDPDGVLLEFAAWTRPLTDADVRHEPARAVPRDADALT